jgi:short subunit dehydrogenase-like uncharacterized protein
VEREVDVAVLGATGVTGRRVAAYLASRAIETNSRWVAAGRDPDKVRRVLAEEGVHAAELATVDIARPKSLKALAERCRVVLNLVGPYAPVGREVVAACVEGGAHYVDISGEMQFIRRVITEFDEAARAAGVKVVQPAGFESLPADLLVRALAERAKEGFQQSLDDVELEGRIKNLLPGLPRPSDGMSGGTSQTMVAALLDDDAAVAVDPAALTVDPARAEHIRILSPIQLRPRRGSDGSVIAPMIPVAFINPAVIQRAAELSGDPPFRYREGIALRSGGARRAPSLALAGILGALQALQRSSVHASPAARRRYARMIGAVMPTSGFGPRPDRLEGYAWSMTVHARTSSGHTVGGRVSGSGHVGYLATARMMGETGLLLSEDGATPPAAGCLPPSLALGTRNLSRFTPAGLTFQID